MKKAIFKSIMILISIFTMVSTVKAEKVVSFDHLNKTITVSANFISFNKNNEALKDAISYWNN